MRWGIRARWRYVDDVDFLAEHCVAEVDRLPAGRPLVLQQVPAVLHQDLKRRQHRRHAGERLQHDGVSGGQGRRTGHQTHGQTSAEQGTLPRYFNGCKSEVVQILIFPGKGEWSSNYLTWFSLELLDVDINDYSLYILVFWKHVLLASS